MDSQRIYSLFQENGGIFSIPVDNFVEKLSQIKAFLFDWDGVFNTGQKSPQFPSTFLEADSMGLNMLRFGYWLSHQHTQAYCGIITGANNEGARKFAQREHLHEVFFSFSQKQYALRAFCKTHDLASSQVCYVFDDVNDIGIAGEVGLRIQIPRPGSLLFDNYIADNEYCDYRCRQTGGNFAVRESCELLLGMFGTFEEAITLRSSTHATYQLYWKDRQSIQTQFIDGKV
ncbi:MAG: phosphatase [Bacteroidota bacterium]